MTCKRQSKDSHPFDYLVSFLQNVAVIVIAIVLFAIFFIFFITDLAIAKLRHFSEEITQFFTNCSIVCRVIVITFIRLLAETVIWCFFGFIVALLLAGILALFFIHADKQRQRENERKWCERKTKIGNALLPLLRQCVKMVGKEQVFNPQDIPKK